MIDFTEAAKELRQVMKEIDDDLDNLADSCEPEMKLAVTKWVMKHIAAHGSEGGSYRYLIYNRLGFGTDAYAPLCNDGLFISNEFDADALPNAREALAAGDHEKLKKILSCCDEPGCYKVISCGFPTEDDGYRQTCYDHMKKNK